MQESLIISIMAFASGLITATFGFGAGLVLTPLLTFLMPIKEALALSTVIYFFTAGSKTWWYRTEIDSETYFQATLAALPGLVLGFLLISYSDSTVLERLFAIVLIVFALAALRGEGKRPLQMFPLPVYSFAGGLLSVLVHGGGIMFFRVCRLRGLERMRTVGTMAAIHFTMNIIKWAFFAKMGLVAMSDVQHLIPACIAAVFGTRLGRSILKRYVSERQFSLGVAVLLLILAARFLIPAG